MVYTHSMTHQRLFGGSENKTKQPIETESRRINSMTHTVIVDLGYTELML